MRENFFLHALILDYLLYYAEKEQEKADEEKLQNPSLSISNGSVSVSSIRVCVRIPYYEFPLKRKKTRRKKSCSYVPICECVVR